MLTVKVIEELYICYKNKGSILKRVNSKVSK